MHELCLCQYRPVCWTARPSLSWVYACCLQIFSVISWTDDRPKKVLYLHKQYTPNDTSRLYTVSKWDLNQLFQCWKRGRRCMSQWAWSLLRTDTYGHCCTRWISSPWSCVQDMPLCRVGITDQNYSPVNVLSGSWNNFISNPAQNLCNFSCLPSFLGA
jgi:hypothetical protein